MFEVSIDHVIIITNNYLKMKGAQLALPKNSQMIKQTESAICINLM